MLAWTDDFIWVSGIFIFCVMSYGSWIFFTLCREIWNYEYPCEKVTFKNFLLKLFSILVHSTSVDVVWWWKGQNVECYYLLEIICVFCLIQRWAKALKAASKQFKKWKTKRDPIAHVMLPRWCFLNICWMGDVFTFFLIVN